MTTPIPKEEILQSIYQTEGGFCLWVGAGATICLVNRQASVPDWDTLTAEMESLADVSGDMQMNLPSRLERCRSRLREKDREHEFDQYLRQRYYHEVCRGVLRLARVQNEAFKNGAKKPIDIVPEHIRWMAVLGQVANPIVNFNIEHLSSITLGWPCGPVKIIALASRDVAWTRNAPSSFFRRCVYHPHGLAYGGGGTVMTNSEYVSKQASLAAAIPVHCGFGLDIVIVGMSCREPDLIEYITKYRKDVRRIIWYESASLMECNTDLCTELQIEFVPVEWNTFWRAFADIDVELHDSGNSLRQAWYLTVDEAAQELDGGHLNQLLRGLGKAVSPPSGFTALAERLAHKGLTIGESGEEETVDGISPQSIRGDLFNLLNQDRTFCFPEVSYSGSYDLVPM